LDEDEWCGDGCGDRALAARLLLADDDDEDDSYWMEGDAG
jgi:hypothetical protein